MRATDNFGYFLFFCSVVIILFSVFYCISYLNKARFSAIKNKSGGRDGNIYSENDMQDELLEVGTAANYDFKIEDHTFINLCDKIFPMAYGEVTYIMPHWTGNRPSTTKSYYLVANSAEKHSCIRKYPNIFKFACSSNEIEVYWVKDLRRLQKVLTVS